MQAQNEETRAASGSVQAVIASINALSCENNERSSSSRRNQFIKNRSKSTIERPTNKSNGDNLAAWQNRESNQQSFNNNHRLTSPSSSKDSNNFHQFSPNSANMNLRSSLRLGRMNNQNEKDNIYSFGDLNIIHTNNAHMDQIWGKRPSTMFQNFAGRNYENNANRNTVGGYGGYETEDDHESNLDSIPNSREGTSLNVLRRREPLGASGNKPDHPKSPSQREVQREKAHETYEQDNKNMSFRSENVDPSSNFQIQRRFEEESTHEIVIQNEIGPLGIHVVPRGEDGRLLVQGIEPGGRVDRDGRLAVGDQIVRINGYALYDTPFDKAQEIFKEALYAKELRLDVVQGHELYGDEMSPEGKLSVENVHGNDNMEGKQSQSNTSTLTKPTEPLAAGTKITSAVHANNTRKIGKKINVELRKGHSGLGFSITTRDNALGNDTPIYIKNIMAKGAAIEEGSLKPGDRLLEVNEVTVDGMSQSEVVTLLKNAPLNSLIHLVVSRHSTTPGSQPSQEKSQTCSPDKEKDMNSPQHETANNANSKFMNSKDQVPKKIQFDPALGDDASEANRDSIAGSRNLPEQENTKPRSLASNSPLTSSDNFEDVTGEENQFPWKQRQILTFDIPVHDSERAGLGVSVKGKNSNGKDGGVSGDLGIFVKSVLYGGAASLDGRLKTNDQLVNINGMSLLGKANSEAMETLRMAMHAEGPIPGVITLTVARRYAEMNSDTKSSSSHDLNKPSNFHQQQMNNKNAQQRLNMVEIHHEKRDSMSSIGVTSSDDEVVREYNIAQAQPNFKMPAGLKATRNPVVDRLMGKDGSIGGPRHTSSSVGVVPSNLRNDSYYMATHDNTFLNGTTVMQQHLNIQSGGPIHTDDSKPRSMTTSAGGHHNIQPLLIEREDTGSRTTSESNLRSYDQESQNQHVAISSSVEDVDATTESLTSLVEVKPQAFSRDQPGRQSMSEKRHATLDAKNTDTYQKRKKARDEREKQQRLEQQQRMWKKSASLESLHIQPRDGGELAEDEREALRTAYVRANSVRVSRNRGINESFRAAVDRSYEQREFPGVSIPGHLQHARDTNEDPVQRHPDFVIEDLDAANEENQSNKSNVPAHAVLRRNKSNDNNTKDKKNNRNSRLLTGLSNMFTKGSKKSNPELNPSSHPENVPYENKRNNQSSMKPNSVPNALPSNSSSISGGSTSAVAGSSASGAISSSSSLIGSNHMPHSQSVHGSMSGGYAKSRSGGTLYRPNEEQPNSMKTSLSGDHLMLHNQRLQKQQHPFYQQHGTYMQQAPPMPRRPAPVFDPQKHLREQQLKSHGSLNREANDHTRSHSHPRPPPKDMYDYLPSAMMRPGSRVGIADPLCAESTDYDVIQRLQQQPPTQPYPPSNHRSAPPPPPPMQQHLNLIQQHHQQHQNYPYAYYPDGGGMPVGPSQHYHIRSGSNLSNGSSSNNNYPSSSSNLIANAQNPGIHKSRRPKSNYYEYESYNNNHGNYADVPSQQVTRYGGNQHPPMQQQLRGDDYHHQQQTMYSLPRSTTTLPSLHKQSQYFHTDYS